MRIVLLLLLFTALVACASSPAPRPCPAPAPCPAAPPCPGSPGPAEGGEKVAAPLDVVRALLLRAINERTGAPLWESFDGTMRKVLSKDQTTAFLEGVYKELGPVKSAEALEVRGGHGVYLLVAEKGKLRLTLDVHEDGRIRGLSIKKAPPPPPPVARVATALRLPVRGEWSVFWGGDTAELNQHVSAGSQRRAADLVMVGEDGQTHRGDGKRNEDYLAFGRPVLAAAAGKVVMAVDGVPDNVPGQMNRLVAIGNAVLIRHDDGMFGFYAHFKQGSVRVKAGQRVKPGAVLGLCGNSGNSSETHLHFHVMDGPDLDQSWGVEPVFRGVRLRRDGATSEPADYTFLKGDLLSDSAKGK